MIVMKTELLISVIVPVYNTEQYLRQCLDSILVQTYRQLEIILVDDGSTDNSLTICNDYASKDSRITVFQTDHVGVSAARNKALDVSHGEYIGFVDSDDYILPDMYENLVKGFSADHDIYVVGGMIIMDDMVLNKKEPMRPNKWSRSESRIVKGDGFGKAIMSETTDHYVWSKLYRREIFDCIRFFEGRKDEDTMFFYQLSKLMKHNSWNMLEIPRVIYNYRIRPSSICTSTIDPLRIDRLKNLDWILNDAQNEMPELIEHIKVCKVRTLIWFMEEICINEGWLSKYWWNCQKEIWRTPNIIGISSSRYRTFLIQKYNPLLYILRKKIIRF